MCVHEMCRSQFELCRSIGMSGPVSRWTESGDMRETRLASERVTRTTEEVNDIRTVTDNQANMQ